MTLSELLTSWEQYRVNGLLGSYRLPFAPTQDEQRIIREGSNNYRVEIINPKWMVGENWEPVMYYHEGYALVIGSIKPVVQG